MVWAGISWQEIRDLRPFAGVRSIPDRIHGPREPSSGKNRITRPNRAGRARPIAEQGSLLGEAKRLEWLSYLTSEERRAFARHGGFAAHKQRGLAAIPRNLPRDGAAC